MKAIIWSLGSDGLQHKAGYFSIENGQLVMRMVPGNEKTMRMIWTSEVLDPYGYEIEKADQNAWLRALPFNYTGTAVRAEFVE
jgi:hypothetical protein